MLFLFIGDICMSPLDIANKFEIDFTTYEDVENYRLPTNIIPKSYGITLKPYLRDTDGTRQFTFDGVAEIVIVPQESTKLLELHSKSLNYSSMQYWKQSASNLIMELPNPVVNTTTDKLIFNFDAELLEQEEYVLAFKYVGLMQDDMRGFYRSSYKDSKNVTKSVWKMKCI